MIAAWSIALFKTPIDPPDNDGGGDDSGRAHAEIGRALLAAPLQLRSDSAAPSSPGAPRARLRTTVHQSVEHRATIMAIRLTARRALMLEADANDHETQLELLVSNIAAALLDESGVGTLTAAEIICAGSHPGRLRSEAAFAMLAGVAQLPASSGQVTRHRLSRCGDRLLNSALHTIVLSRLT